MEIMERIPYWMQAFSKEIHEPNFIFQLDTRIISDLPQPKEQSCRILFMLCILQPTFFYVPQS